MRLSAATSAIDDTVAGIERTYDENLRLEEVSSWVGASSSSSAPTPLNKVRFDYDGFGQLTSDAQYHDGIIAKPVSHAHENGAANTIRRKSMAYTDGSTKAARPQEQRKR